MKEKERLEVVKRVKHSMEEFNEIEKCKIELNALMQDEKVKRYITLKEKILAYAHNENLFKGKLENMIHYNFTWGLRSIIRDQSFGPCSHDIWICTGSHAVEDDPRAEHDFKWICEDEEDVHFSYNEYECLECGEKIESRKWKKFENKHFVLKDRNQRNVEYYRNLYYQLLYTNPADISQQMIIDEFNKTKVKYKHSRKKQSSKKLLCFFINNYSILIILLFFLLFSSLGKDIFNIPSLYVALISDSFFSPM